MTATDLACSMSYLQLPGLLQLIESSWSGEADGSVPYLAAAVTKAVCSQEYTTRADTKAA